jgi:hypothetical protein
MRCNLLVYVAQQYDTTLKSTETLAIPTFALAIYSRLSVCSFLFFTNLENLSAAKLSAREFDCMRGEKLFGTG